jgi:small-conductance mechanosensitive channel
MEFILQNWHGWIWPVCVLAGAILAARIAHVILFFVLKRLARRKGDAFVSSLVRHAEGPSRWILPLLTLLVALPLARLSGRVHVAIERLAGLVLIAAVAWLFILVIQIVSDLAAARYRIDLPDNLSARRVQTQIEVLHRIVVVIVVIVTVSVMLMTFPTIKHIGMSLLASAGLAGLVVGMAMKSTLSSLIAGIQIAFTQPIRMEDAVVVEGEWGWIEEIGTTYVIVRIWDLRRLVLPLSYFIERPFQNWTRSSSALLGNIILYVDYTVPVEELRAELGRILKSTNLWAGKVCTLQVTDAKEGTIQLRALMDAPDSGAAWDLRCYVREKLIQFLQEKYPDALPKVRAEFQGLPPEHQPRNAQQTAPVPDKLDNRMR